MQQAPKYLLYLLICSFLLVVACRTESSEKEHKEANTPAGKVGQVAYEAAKESGKVAKEAARESGKVAKVAVTEASKAAHEVHEGWKEASQKDKAK